eukprot:249177-Pyramimonas_sp.AAC.1
MNVACRERAKRLERALSEHHGPPLRPNRRRDYFSRPNGLKAHENAGTIAVVGVPQPQEVTSVRPSGPLHR